MFPGLPHVVVPFGTLISSHGIYFLSRDCELRRPPWYTDLCSIDFFPLFPVLERIFCKLQPWSLDIFSVVSSVSFSNAIVVCRSSSSLPGLPGSPSAKLRLTF